MLNSDWVQTPAKLVTINFDFDQWRFGGSSVWYDWYIWLHFFSNWKHPSLGYSQ
jgi:hypothetical protein